MWIFKRRVIITAASLLLSFASGAVARADVATARMAFDAGQYAQALDVLNAPQLSSSDEDRARALALRSEIISTQIMLGLAQHPHRQAELAREIAYEGVLLDPQSTESYIQYALAYGLEARSSGIFKAWRKKLPEKCKTVIDEAYRRAPNDARPSALIGAWHLGIVRKAGERRAQSMYGASEAYGMEWYEAALQIKPDDLVILSNYAIALLGIDSERHMDYAAELMKRADGLAPANAMESGMQGRIHLVIEALDQPELLARRIDAIINDKG